MSGFCIFFFFNEARESVGSVATENDGATRRDDERKDETTHLLLHLLHSVSSVIVTSHVSHRVSSHAAVHCAVAGNNTMKMDDP